MARRELRIPYFSDKMDMTPLIDCVFLLIMFFVLTSQITVNVENVSLPFGTEGQAEKPGTGDTVIVLNVQLVPQPKMRGDASIILEGAKMTTAMLRERLQEQVNYDMSPTGRQRAPEIAADGTKLSQVKVRVRIDKQARAEYLREIFSVCAEVTPKIYRIEVSIEHPSGN
jgi:biopolymer transport protein ExbD